MEPNDHQWGGRVDKSGEVEQQPTVGVTMLHPCSQQNAPKPAKLMGAQSQAHRAPGHVWTSLFEPQVVVHPNLFGLFEVNFVKE